MSNLRDSAGFLTYNWAVGRQPQLKIRATHPEFWVFIAGDLNSLRECQKQHVLDKAVRGQGTG